MIKFEIRPLVGYIFVVEYEIFQRKCGIAFNFSSNFPEENIIF
jgi:hypothetical protein